MATRQDNRCGSPDPLIEVLPPCNYKHVDDEVDHHLNEVLISRSIDDSEKYRDPSEINPDPILLLSGVEAGELDVDVPLVCDSKSWIYSSLLEGCGDNGVFYPFEDRTVIPSLAGLRISDDGPDSVKLVSKEETLVEDEEAESSKSAVIECTVVEVGDIIDVGMEEPVVSEPVEFCGSVKENVVEGGLAVDVADVVEVVPASVEEAVVVTEIPVVSAEGVSVGVDCEDAGVLAGDGVMAGFRELPTVSEGDDARFGNFPNLRVVVRLHEFNCEPEVSAFFQRVCEIRAWLEELEGRPVEGATVCPFSCPYRFFNRLTDELSTCCRLGARLCGVLCDLKFSNESLDFGDITVPDAENAVWRTLDNLHGIKMELKLARRKITKFCKYGVTDASGHMQTWC